MVLGLAKTIRNIIAVIIAMIAGLVIAGFAVTFCCDPIPEPIPEPIPGTIIIPTPEPQIIVRNCIKSVLGNPPQCSDTSEERMSTYCNGRELGPMTYSDAVVSCS